MVVIDFKTKAAQRIYEDYMKRVGKNISALSAADKTDLLQEFNSHIYEGMTRAKAENEIDALLEITEKLGTPEEFLKPLVAKKKLNQAVKTFNPKDVFLAIVLNIKNSLIYPVFAVLYLFLFSFLIVIFTKLLSPTHTGLFFSSAGFRGFGYIREISGLTEVLGYWIILLSVIIASVLYFIITLLLRITRKE